MQYEGLEFDPSRGRNIDICREVVEVSNVGELGLGIVAHYRARVIQVRDIGDELVIIQNSIAEDIINLLDCVVVLIGERFWQLECLLVEYRVHSIPIRKIRLRREEFAWYLGIDVKFVQNIFTIFFKVAIIFLSDTWQGVASVHDKVPLVRFFGNVTRAWILQQNSIIIIGAIHVFNLIWKLDSCSVIGVYFGAKLASVIHWILARFDLRPDRWDVPVDLIFGVGRALCHVLELVGNEQIEPAQLVKWKAAIAVLREESVRWGGERPVVKYGVEYVDAQPVGQ